MNHHAHHDDNNAHAFCCTILEPSDTVEELAVFLYDCPAFSEGADDDEDTDDEQPDNDDAVDEDEMDGVENNDENLQDDEDDDYADAPDERPNPRNILLTPSQLRTRLQSLPSARDATCLQMDLADGLWYNLSDRQWSEVCNILRDNLPSLRNVQIECAENLQDVKWKTFLEQVLMPRSHQLQTFSMHEVGNIPSTMERIGSLSALQVLSLTDERRLRSQAVGLTVECCSKLANSLSRLPALRKLTIANLITIEPNKCYTLLLNSIRRIATLKRLNINGGWGKIPTTEEEHAAGTAIKVERYRLEKSILEDSKFGPRLNQAKQEFLLSKQERGIEITLSDWVEALISVHDRIDCLHHLLTEMDPNMYACAGLEAAQKASSK